METKEIILAEALKKRSIISSVLLVRKDKELSQDLKSKIMNVRIRLGRFEKQYSEESKEALNGFKTEGFDERLKANREFEQSIKESHPDVNVDKFLSTDNLTEEEKKGKETRESLAKEIQALNKQCADFESKKFKENVKVEIEKFTQKEFEEILNVNSDGQYKVNMVLEDGGIVKLLSMTVSAPTFMELLYDEFVDVE